MHEKFTWRRTAEGYLTVIQEGMAKKEYIKEDNLDLNGKELIINYLKNKI